MANGTLTSLEVRGAGDVSPVRLAGYVNARVLGIATAETVTVPANAKYARIAKSAAMAVLYVSTTGTAAAPGDTTDGTASELCPEWIIVNGSEAISLISDIACVVTVSFYTN